MKIGIEYGAQLIRGKLFRYEIFIPASNFYERLRLSSYYNTICSTLPIINYNSTLLLWKEHIKDIDIILTDHEKYLVEQKLKYYKSRGNVINPGFYKVFELK